MASIPPHVLAWVVKQIEKHVAEVEKALMDATSMVGSNPADALHTAAHQILDATAHMNQVAINCNWYMEHRLSVAKSTPPAGPNTDSGFVVHHGMKLNEPTADDLARDARITEDDLAEAREMESSPSPEHRPLWKVLEDMGIDYDSDQSRGC
ncbi:hypothetical protein GQ55_7G127300 [Panicum hallii var. hallii]|uniref:Uncharacterized protein n=1 Tax=Panicum hallii var. hallii TaxID=1504633 RepID=A0A2T7CUG5_9POAL|nr:hypothetical protein GQ55_7G127300 [Panicum hallii var. hallii]